MKFVISILMIHFIVALIEKAIVKDKIEIETSVDDIVKHPAEFSIR